ncbi:hypothetical protein AB0L44_30050 [Nonomuraea wenchangensis]|uniref:hypothetical protein n=1 Tax=Nonomuraea wenchangensis TaxID=568860 RepID=UPI003448FE00
MERLTAVRSPALLCAMAAPVLYLVVNLIAIQAAVVDPPGDWMLGPLDRERASARMWTFSIALILAAEAAFLGALDGWLNRRPEVARVVPRAVVGVGYLLSLALAVAADPTSSLWELNDDSALDSLVPAWHFPALVVIGVVALVAVVGWLVGAGRDRS